MCFIDTSSGPCALVTLPGNPTPLEDMGANLKQGVKNIGKTQKRSESKYLKLRFESVEFLIVFVTQFEAFKFFRYFRYVQIRLDIFVRVLDILATFFRFQIRLDTFVWFQIFQIRSHVQNLDLCNDLQGAPELSVLATQRRILVKHMQISHFL